MSLPAAQGATRLRPPVSHDTEALQPDAALLRRVASGDHRAFTALYGHLVEVAHRLARRVVTDTALAEEVTQEAFLTVWLKAATYDPSRGSARAWILTITHRRAVDAVRLEESNRNRLRRSASLTVDRAYDVVVERILLRAAAESADIEVTRALAALTPLQREAIELAYFDGLTHAEVALLLDVPLSTAKTRMRDGLTRLAIEIRAASGTDPEAGDAPQLMSRSQ